MDFSSACLDKKTEFGILWYYGNKEGKIVLKDVEKINPNILYQFIKLHKDVIEYEHWTILFKGFFVIMLNRLELINRKFKTLSINVKKKAKPTISELELISGDQIDADLLSIEPPPIKKKATTKQIVKQQKKQENLIKEKPTILLDETDLDGNENQQLADDGFGGNLLSNDNAVDIDDYFNLTRTDQQRQPNLLQFDDELQDLSPIKKVSRFETIDQTFADQVTLVQDRTVHDNLQSREQFLSERTTLPSSIGLPDLTITEHFSQEEQTISSIEKAAQSELGRLTTDQTGHQDTTSIQDKTLVHDDNLQSREQFLSEQRSTLPSSIGLPDLTIAENLSQEDQPFSRPQSQAASVQSSQQEKSTLTFSLSTIDEQDLRQRRGLKRKHSDNNLIIDNAIELVGSFNRIKTKDERQIFLPVPILSADQLFKRPVLFNRIEPIAEFDFYTTEHCDTDRLIIREIPEQDEHVEQRDYDLDDIGSPARHSPLRYSPIRYSPMRYSPSIYERVDQDDYEIRETCGNLLNELIDQVSMRFDRQTDQFVRDSLESRFESNLDSRIEIQRDGSSRQMSARYYSDFEPMMVQSDVQSTQFTARSLFDRRDLDLDSLRSYRADEMISKVNDPNQSILSELSLSFIDTILDTLDDNDGEITFSDLTRGFKRKEAAKCFADLLVLKMRREIEMIQHDTTYFAEIYIKKT